MESAGTGRAVGSARTVGIPWLGLPGPVQLARPARSARPARLAPPGRTRSPSRDRRDHRAHRNLCRAIGPSGPIGPSNAFTATFTGTKSLPRNTATTVITKSLTPPDPSDNYVIAATVGVSASGFAADVSCTLTAGSLVDTEVVTVGGGGSHTQVALNASGALTAATTVTVACKPTASTGCHGDDRFDHRCPGGFAGLAASSGRRRRAGPSAPGPPAVASPRPGVAMKPTIAIDG